MTVKIWERFSNTYEKELTQSLLHTEEPLSLNVYKKTRDGMQSTPRSFVRVVEASRMYQKCEMLSRLVDGQWLYREIVHALRGPHELNKMENQNKVMGCGTWCNVI